MQFFNRKKPKDSICNYLEDIKHGNVALKEKLIEDYKPFIINTVSRTIRKYVEVENSDEYSIGLLAFNEAIDSYDKDMKTNFIKFSEIVIKRRLIDYMRKNKKDRKTFPFTYFSNNDNEDFEVVYAEASYPDQFQSIETKEEIYYFERKLSEFGITLADLVISSPKHTDSKLQLIKIAKLIAENEFLFKRMNRRKNIPMVDLMKMVSVNQRTIERNRKFIIAVSLILKSNLEVLKRYVESVNDGG
ncbi:MAG: RNA polymerase sigma-I factor [Bacillota bacterium]